MITMDFETRSIVDLRKAGAYRYSIDPSTQALCLAWVYDDEEEVHLWHPDFLELPEEGRWQLEMLFERVADGERMEIEAHNAFFERCIWNNSCVPRWGWPKISPSQLSCSAALAASYSLPRKLEDACLALGVTEQKDMSGHRHMQKMCKPRKPKKAELKAAGFSDVERFQERHGYLWHEDPEDLRRLFEYCRQDVRAERALSRSLRPISKAERRLWLLDQETNWRGVHIDRAGVEVALDLAEAERGKADIQLLDITLGAVVSHSKRPAFKKWLEGEGCDIPDTTKETIDVWLQMDLPDYLHEALEVWTAAQKASTKKYVTMMDRICPDSRVRDILRFHAGHTGRWGGVGIQPQNFTRGKLKGTEEEKTAKMVEIWHDIICLASTKLQEKYGDVMAFLANAVRGAICAAPRYRFMVADYSSIEARVLFWIAGALRALQVLSSGQNIYKDLAGAVFNLPNPQALSKDDSKYQLGKQGVLGLGYQMGALKFQATCASYGIDITFEMAEEVVKLYRSTYPEVRSLWYQMEAQAINAVKSPGTAWKCKNTIWGTRGKFLHCKLPSGRLMSYYDPQIVPAKTPWGELTEKLTYMGEDSQTHKWKRLGTYGGKLVENVVQAVSRDLMAEAMLCCSDMGYPIVLTVHDEIVAEVPDGFGNMEEFELLMSMNPAWAKGLPSAVEGWEGVRYRK